jgi:hypothetical protein
MSPKFGPKSTPGRELNARKEKNDGHEAGTQGFVHEFLLFIAVGIA